jgi:hypothetical protein
MAMSQKSIHNIAIQILDNNLFLFQPPAEIGNYDDLLSDGVVSVTLIGYSQRPHRRRGVHSKVLGAVVQSCLRR